MLPQKPTNLLWEFTAKLPFRKCPHNYNPSSA